MEKENYSKGYMKDGSCLDSVGPLKFCLFKGWNDQQPKFEFIETKLVEIFKQKNKYL